ncbi:unnamed protein product [Trichobilharzia regenti]|nr:unnamed protein product [Trichobilharzia regenti]
MLTGACRNDKGYVAYQQYISWLWKSQDAPDLYEEQSKGLEDQLQVRVIKFSFVLRLRIKLLLINIYNSAEVFRVYCHLGNHEHLQFKAKVLATSSLVSW